MRKLGLFLVLSLALGVPAAGRDFLVSNVGGDGRFSGHQWQGTTDFSGPLRTVARALEEAGPGDRIVLAATGQPYSESLSLVGSRHSGSSTRPFAIIGNGAVLDGSMPVPGTAWKHYEGAMFVFHPACGGAEQLFLGAKPAAKVSASRIAERPPRLKPLQWCLCQGDIYFCVEKDRLPRDYPLRVTSLTTGITLFQVHNVVLADLVIQGYRVDGVSAANSARDIQLRGLTCRGNARSGVSVGGASIVDIEGCLLGNNGEAQLLTLPISETHVRSSSFLPLTAPGWVDQGGRFFLEGKPLRGGLEKIEGGDKVTR